MKAPSSCTPCRAQNHLLTASLSVLLAVGLVAVSTSHAARSTPRSLVPKPNSVTSAQVRNESLTSSDIKNGTISGIDIKDGSLTAADLATGSIGSSHLQAGSVGSTALVDGAVQSRHLAQGSVASASIASGAVGSVHLANNAVGSESIQDASIQLADISQDAINAISGGLQSNSISAVHLQDGAVTGAKILNGTITGADLQNETLTGANILNGTVQTIDLQNGAVTSAKVADGSIDVADLTPAARAASSSAPMQPGQVQRGFYGLNSTGSVSESYQLASIDFGPPTGANVALRITTAAGNGAQCPAVSPTVTPASGNLCIYILTPAGGPSLNGIFTDIGTQLSTANGTNIPGGSTGLLLEYIMDAEYFGQVRAYWAVTQ